jgi:Protein of unknown function (DUF3558)
MRLKTMAATLLATALLVAACGGGDDDGSDASDDEATPATTEAADPSDDADDDASGGEVPDPCTLLPAPELTALLGADQGTGTVQAVAPDQRKVCTYDSGLFLAVELAENWDASISLIESSGVGSVQEVPGVGEAAIWQDIGGGVGQFVALGPEYFVGVTLSGDQAAGQAVAEAMLAAL